MKDKSYLTAIGRKGPSRPMRWLSGHNLLAGRCLDYGCGRGFDADFMKMDKYDPYYFPAGLGGKYDTITCLYVLNVLSPKKAADVLGKIGKLLRKGGHAYVAVRRGIGKEGCTSKGTYQRTVRLRGRVLFEDRGCCLYQF